MAHLFNRLLLATEHSEFDTGAEAMAFALAQRCQLPLATVVPLLSNPEYEALAPQIAAKAEQEAAVKIARLREQAAGVGVTIDLRLRRGEEPYQEIVQEAMQQGSDLIIIRRRGKRGFLANLLVGEMVSKVVTHAPCHVLIVPREAHLWSQRVLAGEAHRRHSDRRCRRVRPAPASGERCGRRRRTPTSRCVCRRNAGAGPTGGCRGAGGGP
jgi:nucleotide-binding universal stress UspA family protein